MRSLIRLIYYPLTVLLLSHTAIALPEITHEMVNVPDGIKVRVTHIPANGSSERVIVVFQGRESFYEKGEEFYSILAGRADSIAKETHVDNPFKNCDVWVIDRRGQGMSEGRLDPNDQRDHIDNFNTYLEDYDAVIRRHILPKYNQFSRTFFLMGISLGGHLAFRYQQMYEASTPFSKLLLIVPMIQFKTDHYPEIIARAVVKTACAIGFCQWYALGRGPINPDTLDFHGERSHHDVAVFRAMQSHLKENPHFITGGPTFGWVHAGYKSIDESSKPSNLEISKKTPITFFVAGDDHIVDSYAALELARKLGVTSVKYYPGAWHSITHEVDKHRLTFLQDLWTEISSHRS